MLITRATRRELGDVAEFYESQGWFEGHETPDLKVGTAYIARQGPIIGCVRLIEIDPQMIVIDDVVVAEERRGNGVGAQLMQAAMNSRGGTLYLCCHPEHVGFYERFGFELVEFEGLPAPTQSFYRKAGEYPTDEGHIHLFLTAR